MANSLSGIEDLQNTVEFKANQANSMMGKGGRTPASPSHNFEENIIPGGQLFTEENIHESELKKSPPKRVRPFSSKMKGSGS